MVEIQQIKELFPSKIKSWERGILAVFAHPDDESLQIGGLLARAAEEKIKTSLLCLSKGGQGIVNSQLTRKRLKAVREKELFEAVRLLKVKDVILCKLPDSRLYYIQNKIDELLQNMIRRTNPGVIVTHDPSGITGHPDHITTSLVVKSVIRKHFGGDVQLYFVVYGEKLKQTLQNSTLKKKVWRTMPSPTHWLSTDKFVDVKVNACLAHKSQHLDRSKSVDLNIWFQLFDREYLHKVDLHRDYRFQFSKFKAANFKFIPDSDAVILI